MKKTLAVVAVAAAFVVFNACKKNTPSSVSDGEITLDLPAQTAVYFSPSSQQAPLQNEKATLGRVLFYDNHLSVNNAVACASCHKQQLAFADNVAFSRGFENKLTGRNSPGIQNLPLLDQQFGGGGSAMGALFWDGRENNPKNLIMRPITNHVEMGIEDANALVSKLKAASYYKDLFKTAYGDDAITTERISESIAFFITAIRANNTRFDQYRRGQANLSALEMQGMALFSSKYKCNRCHNLDSGINGYITSNEDFLNIGLDMSVMDKGRGGITGNPLDMGTFKVPNLRNVALTAPYMHDGRFTTLDDVLEHYSRKINDNANLAEDLRGTDGKPLRMNISKDEKTALVAFLGTLTDTRMTTDVRYANPFKIK